jgi:hypothetical protein
MSADTPVRLSPEREAEIAARVEAATPGPWCTDSWEIYQGAEYVAGAEWIGETCRAGEMDDSRADAEFVAHARTDVPALLAELAAVRAERDQARAEAIECKSSVDLLNALHAAGVDNWDGYDEAMEQVR